MWKCFLLLGIILQSAVAVKATTSHPAETCTMVSLVSGANRGIGLELCKQLVSRGDKVFAACRSSSPALDALGVHKVIEGVDVTSDKSMDHLVSSVGPFPECRGSHETLDDLDFDRILQQFSVNTLGPLRVTKALLPTLKAGSKIVIITSRMGSVEDNTSGAFYGYRISKAGVNVAGKSLSIDLHDRGIAVGIFHPGMVATDMTARWGTDGCISAEESVRGLLARTDALNLENSGKFFHQNGQELPW